MEGDVASDGVGALPTVAGYSKDHEGRTQGLEPLVGSMLAHPTRCGQFVSQKDSKDVGSITKVSWKSTSSKIPFSRLPLFSLRSWR